MHTLTAKFIRLKTAVGGNREKSGFEYTFGLPEEEARRITPPSRMNRRILAELEYALHLNEANGNRYGAELEKALDELLAAQAAEGALTNRACIQAEEMLAPMAELAKSYQLILTGHAHIDMNWMWSWQETVAATLSTFRTMCGIMDEYPEFTFTQSQGSVYRIVEEYDPELMERMRKHISEGRWEVAATNWVEPDKNMPGGESLLRHIEYTRKYLREVWGVQDFDLDFVPDTFGHALTIPEIDRFGGVRYMYHCRGNAREELLYRYRAASGRELLVLREANWYNLGITPQIASGLMEVVKRSSGLKTGMVVYGVGDHGGGPTRRDVERAMDMMTWPIYPTIRFGGLRDYFREAEAIRDRLPVVRSEMNFFAPGCYTTQSRIKRGNRRAEAALYDTEAMAALAGMKTGFRMPEKQMEKAWRNVLFTHFHDIITGSCVQDSREYAMGLYQETAAVTNTQQEKAMTALIRQIDTADLPALRHIPQGETAEAARFDSQSEGAGVGFGIEHFTGVPAAERGSGLTRVYHVFNTLTETRDGIAEITVWDYPDMPETVRALDVGGHELVCQPLDAQPQRYWDHRYFRLLVRVKVPAVGYTTVILRPKERDSYPVYLQNGDHVSRLFDDTVLDNGLVRAVIDRRTGRVSALTDLASGTELLKPGETAGLEWLDTERRSSSAWEIGRVLRDTPVDQCIEMTRAERGENRQSIKVTWQIPGGCRTPSRAEAEYALDAGSRALRVSLRLDWQEQGGDTVPVLTWRTPVNDCTGQFRYLIPAGSILRPALNNDVPGIGGAAALRKEGTALALISDSKYGYRGEAEALSLTLINSATNPDPYPERGIHQITLWMAPGGAEAGELQRMTDRLNHPMRTQPGRIHAGSLPAEAGLAELKSGNAAVTAVLPEAEGILIRGYETSGEDGKACVEIHAEVKEAWMTDLSESGGKVPAQIEGEMIRFAMRGGGIWAVKAVCQR